MRQAQAESYTIALMVWFQLSAIGAALCAFLPIDLTVWLAVAAAVILFWIAKSEARA